LNHGEIAILPGPAMAGADFFDIVINGYGAHGAMPERSKDAVIIAMTVGQALQTIVSRNVDPLLAAVVSITQIHSGSAYNVIPGEAKLCGTVRAFSDDVRALVRERMRTICAGMAAAFQVEINVDIRDIFSVLVNQEEQSRVVERFYRGAQARHIPGTGMGLAIVQQIARAHGGTLTISSSPDAGTTFTLSLPRGGPAS
jgi:hippurate hydrolase